MVDVDQNYNEQVFRGSVELFMEFTMNIIKTSLLVATLCLSVIVGCLGYSMIRDNHWGWVLLVVGVAYPCALIISIYQRHKRFRV